MEEFKEFTELEESVKENNENAFSEEGANAESFIPNNEVKEPFSDSFNEKNEEKTEEKKSNGAEIAGFVLSAASLIFLAGVPFLGVIFGTICAILGICLGAPFKKEKSPLAVAGFTVSVVALVLSALSAVIYLLFGNAIINAVVYFINQNSSPFGFGSPFYMFP